ncbi:MAG TPA: hypothetical protein VFM88_06425, partial [Vicinamibacteria bacterium]|nr:hypothetical protein [Vicinamibacteria bacterium]
AALTTTWSKLSGPGSVTFGNASAVDTTASFSVAGTYVLRLTASDSVLGSSDDVTIVVNLAGQAAVDVPVSASSDDAEERINGSVARTSDLELVYSTEGSVTGHQTVGLRFANLNVPQGANILSASLQLTVDEATSGATTLTIRGQDSDNAATFGSSAFNLTSRPTTTAAVVWSPPAWTTVGQAGPDQRTDVTFVIDEIVHRAGWAPGNALALIIQGTGKRVAKAWDNGAPAVLHVEYTTEPINRAPVVTITAPAGGSTHLQTAPVMFTGSAADTEDGDITASLEWTSDLQGGVIGSGGSFSRSDLVPGTHTITATATDGGWPTGSTQTGAAQITLTVHPTGSFATEIRVAAGADDAEEGATAKVSFTSTDLELVYNTEGGVTGNQLVGLRFAGVAIPRGATITNAYVQFTCDEVKTAAALLDIRGQASDNAAAFAKVTGNISTRSTTTAEVLGWSPPAWNVVGRADVAERTPALTSIIQEIVGQGGWSSGNALALIFSGSGVRTARSFESGASVAPLLHVDYTVP